MRRYILQIRHLLGIDARRVPMLLFLFGLNSALDIIGLGLVGPYIMLATRADSSAQKINQIAKILEIDGEGAQVVVILGIGLSLIFIVRAFVATFVTRNILKFGFSQEAKLRISLMSAYQSMPYSKFTTKNTSEYVYTIGTLTHQFAGGVVMPCLRTISDLLLAISILLMLAWINIAALVILVALLGIVLITYDLLFRPILRIEGALANSAATAMYQTVQEGMDGFKEVRVLGGEGFFLRRVEACVEEYCRYSTRSQTIAASPRYVIESTLVIFIVGLVLENQISARPIEAMIATMAAFGVGALRLLPAVTGLTSNLLQLRFNRDAVNKLFDAVRDLDLQTQHLHFDVSNSDGARFEKLEISGVTYTYPGAKRAALENVWLEVQRGESIGIIGSSGAGKTTLVDVILGLLDPDSGTVALNGKPRDTSSSWRGHVAYLPQQTFLLDGSLRRNIALGVDDSSIDDSAVMRAVRQAQLSGVASDLPLGIHTPLGERGIRLSGGQRQRVAIARAFYHGRDVLVMDEATSALDSETEQEISEEIRRLKGTKTLIVIAHRLTTLRDCDRIYRIEGGRLVGSGSYEAMVRHR